MPNNPVFFGSPSPPPRGISVDVATPGRAYSPDVQRRYATALEAADGFDSIFRIVREVVRNVLGRERTGLGLALSDLPSGIGAYWPVTGNVIVMNEPLVRAMKAMASSPAEFNSFVFVILAHEYLHSLGYWGEDPVRRVTAQVVRTTFGPDHVATAMAEGDLWQMYPFLRMAHGGDGSRIRMVSRFDSDTTSAYIR